MAQVLLRTSVVADNDDLAIAGAERVAASSPFIVMQTSSAKLQQRAIQENPTYDEIVNLGISQEQARKKSAKLPDGESESVNRLQTEDQDLMLMKKKFLFVPTTTSQCINDKTEYEPTAKRLS